MTDVKTKISNSSGRTSATVDTTDNSVNTTTRTAFVIARKLEEFTDINTGLIKDGSTLIYNEQKEEWDAINELRAQSIDAGEF
jgi:hypothetical protein